MAQAKLLNKIEKKQALVGVIGLGYVGLPLIRTFCAAGFRVLGFDVDASKVRKLNSGRSYIQHIPSRLVADLVKRRRFRATADPKQLARPDCLIICVPTPLTHMREPDLTYIHATARTVAAALRKDQLVVLESTTYPGTTRDEVQPILEATGLAADRDFFLAFSPEREDPGRTDHTTETIPKVVGGIGPASTKLAVALYAQAIRQVVQVSSCEVAEACKIMENVYRCVNIALVNELKLLFARMNIDVWEVIRAASTKPFGFQAFYPGPGLGGHCIPIDPFYLSWKAKQYDYPTRFIELAGEINTAMPEHVVRVVADALNERAKPLKGSKVLVLGLAYKRDVDDMRESPSIQLIEMLRKRGASVDYNDPHIRRTIPQREHDLRMKSVPLSAQSLSRYDCVLIATDHSVYDYAQIVRSSKLVVDTRNATATVKGAKKNVVKA